MCTRIHNRPTTAPSLVKLGPRTPENRSVKVPNTLKLHGENVLSVSRGLLDFA